MAKVIHLESYRHQHTISVLRVLLERAESGEIGAMAFMVEDLITGERLTGSTGTYKREPLALPASLNAHAADLVASVGGNTRTTSRA
mgnify:CR=1 FL=1